MNLLSNMLKKLDETYLWDNSGTKPNFVGEINKGILYLQFMDIPKWIDTYILNKIKQ